MPFSEAEKTKEPVLRMLEPIWDAPSLTPEQKASALWATGVASSAARLTAEELGSQRGGLFSSLRNLLAGKPSMSAEQVNTIAIEQGIGILNEIMKEAKVPEPIVAQVASKFPKGMEQMLQLESGKAR